MTANINKITYKPNKLGHTDLPFGFLISDSSVGLCMLGYKSVDVAFMLCATVVNTHTHAHTHTHSF